MNNSTQNSEVKLQNRTGIDNSDEDDWSGVIECVNNPFIFRSSGDESYIKINAFYI